MSVPVETTYEAVRELGFRRPSIFMDRIVIIQFEQTVGLFCEP